MPSGAVRWPEPRHALLLVAIVTIWRLGTLAFDATDLWVDEAQYWLWGQHLDWGYFSKPPMIAFWLRAVTDLAGSDSAFWIRASGAVLHAVTAWLVGLSAARLYDPRTGAAAAILYVTLPMASYGSWLFSTDTMLLPFFALAFYAYLRLREAASLPWAFVFGLALGAGFLSKYAVIYLPLSLALATLLVATARISWRDAGTAAVTMLAVAGPNLWWNAATGFTTVRHVAEDNAKVDAASLDPAGAVEFLLGQFAVFGPIPFLALLAAVVLLLMRRAPRHTAMLLVFSLTVVVLMTVQGLRAGANANWAVTGYVAGSVLAARLLLARPRLFTTSLVLHLAVAAALPLAYVSADRIRLPDGRLLAWRYTGSEELGEAIAATAGREGLTTIVATRRSVLADLFHRFRDAPFTLYAPAPSGAPKSYYEQTFPVPATLKGDVLYVTAGPAPCDVANLLETHAPQDGLYYRDRIHFYSVPAECLLP